MALKMKPAAINAFALGAQLTNPRAEIELRWSCCEASPAARLAEEGLRVICARDLPGSGDSPDWRGLCLAQNAGPVYKLLVRDLAVEMSLSHIIVYLEFDVLKKFITDPCPDVERRIPIV